MLFIYSNLVITKLVHEIVQLSVLNSTAKWMKSFCKVLQVTAMFYHKKYDDE